MTDIPGTGKSKTGEKTVIISPQVEHISVVNVREMKKEKSPETPREATLWYDSLRSWMFLGLGVSIIFGILGFLNSRFLFLTPLGPIVTFASWHVRSFVKKVEKKNIFLK